MKLQTFLIVIISLIALVCTASAAVNYTETFAVTDVVRDNQSIVQDPTGGNSIPWDLWIYAGFITLILTVIGLLKPRLYQMDYELTIILSVIAWPFSWYFTWGCLTSIDKIVGVAMASTGGSTMMITQHILYTFPILGWLGVSSDVGLILITILYIAQYNLFKTNDANEKLNGGN